jgi:hypothetical protein
VAGLKRRELAEPGCPVAEGLVFVVGEEGPVVLQTPVDTAVLVVAQPIKLLGPGDRQGLQQDCVHQSEDGRGRPDSQRQRQDRRRRIAGSVDELPHRVAQVVCESHVAPSSCTKRRLSPFGELPSSFWLDDASEPIVARARPFIPRRLLLPLAGRAHLAGPGRRARGVNGRDSAHDERATSAVGIRPCGSCERRAAALNRLLIFSGRRRK